MNCTIHDIDKERARMKARKNGLTSYKSCVEMEDAIDRMKASLVRLDRLMRELKYGVVTNTNSSFDDDGTSGEAPVIFIHH